MRLPQTDMNLELAENRVTEPNLNTNREVRTQKCERRA